MFPIKNSLINGAQSLFGLKTKLQFGKTNITAVFSQQNSESTTVTAEGGASIQEFELRATDYDNDRHFFLSQYFRENYSKSLQNYPLISSPINITRIELWITNRNASVEDFRSIVALADIAEPNSEKSILNISELVNELTPVQLLRARLSIEPAIAREAAIHASEADVSRIDAACNAASSATSWSEYERADDLLHHEIAAAAQNPLLMSMFEYLNAVRRAVSWNKVVRSSDRPASDHDSFAEHTLIFAAIAGRNANEAQAAMRTHLISVSKRLFGDD